MAGSTDRVTMSRGLALLFGAGAAMVAVTVVLPHRGGEAQWELLIPCALAVTVAVLLLRSREGWPRWVLELVLAFGTALIGVCVLFSDSAGAAYAFMYIWVALYAAAFFPLRRLAMQVGWAAITYAAVLAITGDVRPGPAQWLMAAGTSAVAATLIYGLSRELRGRANDLAAVTFLANELGASSEVSAELVAHSVCDGVLQSTGASSVVLLEETGDGRGLHVLSRAGSASAAEAFDEPEAIAVLDAAYTSGERRDLGEGDRTVGLVQPVRREGRVSGLLALTWSRPRRRVTTRVAETTALFAAEAGVALERIARQSRERERRALELNDEIVQGLVIAKYALREGRVEMGERAVEETLDRARALVDGQLEELHGRSAPEPGTLRRQRI